MKKKVFTRVLCLLVGLFMLVSLAACSGGSSQADKKDATTGEKTQAVTTGSTAGDTKPNSEVMHIKWIQQVPTQIAISTDTEIGKVLKDKFNVEIEFIPFSGDYRAKLNMMLAASDYPDVLRLEGNDMVEKYAKAGAAVCLEDYIKDSKYFKDRFKEQIPYFRMASGLDKVYAWQTGMPASMDVFFECNDMMVRTDALEKQGWPVLVTEDDYYNFFKKAMADMPETNGEKTIGLVVPLAEPWGMQGIATSLYEKGGPVTATTNSMRSIIWNAEKDELIDKWKYPYAQQTFKFFNRLYRDGLLDKECFTDFLPKVEEKLGKGRALGAWYIVWTMDAANQKLIGAGHPEQQYIKMGVRANEQVAKGEKCRVRVELTRPFDSVCITNNAKDPKRLFELLDWCVSDEGQMLLQSGIEGVHWDKVDGKRVPKDEFKKNILNREWAQKQGLGMFNNLGFFRILASDGQAYVLQDDLKLKDELFATDRQKQAYQALGWKTFNDWFAANSIEQKQGLPASVTIDPASELGQLQQKMVQHWIRFGAKLITAKSDDDYNAIYKQAMDEYEKLNPQRVLDEANKLYQVQKDKLAKVSY